MKMPFRSYARHLVEQRKRWPIRTSYWNFVWGIDDSLPRAEGWLIAFSLLFWGVIALGVGWVLWRIMVESFKIS
jgi:hypothetical protein